MIAVSSSSCAMRSGLRAIPLVDQLGPREHLAAQHRPLTVVLHAEVDACRPGPRTGRRARSWRAGRRSGAALGRAVHRLVDGLHHPLAERVEHRDDERARRSRSARARTARRGCRCTRRCRWRCRPRRSRPSRALRRPGHRRRRPSRPGSAGRRPSSCATARRAVAGDRAVDELGAGGTQRRRRRAPAASAAPGIEVLHEHVGGVDQPVEQRAIAGVLDVELEALLAAIEPDEVAATAPWTVRSYARAKSPMPGRSTLITRAPRSARWRVASGAATACSSETTVMSSSACTSLVEVTAAQRGERVVAIHRSGR